MWILFTTKFCWLKIRSPPKPEEKGIYALESEIPVTVENEDL